MAKEIVASAIVFEVLNKDNYVDWSETIEAYLKAQGLWDVIHSHFQPLQSEKEEEEAWERKNAAALHAIKISCGRENLPVIRGIYQAKEAWLVLEAKFNQQLPTTMVSAYNNSPFYDIRDEERAISDEYKGAYNCLRDDFSRRNWYGIKNYCTAFPSLLKEKISNSRNVPILHELIVYAGRDREDEVVKMLGSDQFPREALEMRNSSGGTALTVAAGVGSIVIAECIVEMNPNLLFIPNDFGLIPLAVSIALHLNDMADYLYLVTPPEVWSHENGKYGATLITKSFEVGNWKIALKLLEYYPNLTLAKDINGKSPVYAAACVPSLFCSSFHHRFLPKWICNYIHAVLGQWIPLDSMDLKISGINLLILIQKAVRAANDDQMKSGLMYDAFFEAIERGNFNFIVMLRYAKREILEELDGMSRNIYMRAIEHRQGNVFSLIFDEKDDDEIKLSVNVWQDKLNNNLLHMAATLAPPTALDCISGPALQIQRELQWFEEVEKLVLPTALTSQNVHGMTPRELFTKNHKDLVVAGEKWMKDTASACAIVGPLIITIMFAAAFQVPGGNDQNNGHPIFLDRKLFKVYMISVAISLFSATSSVLMFLKVLTSNYTEEKFLRSLPNKMIIGLSTLFLSLATMIIAFCSGLALSLQKESLQEESLREESQILIPVTLLAVFPVSFFAWTQFPLLVEIFTSTYWPTSILDRKIINTTIPIIHNLYRYEDKQA